MSDGKFAKFDSQGNSQVAAQLRGKQGKVTVKEPCKLSGDTIQVEQVQIESIERAEKDGRAARRDLSA